MGSSLSALCNQHAPGHSPGTDGIDGTHGTAFSTRARAAGMLDGVPLKETTSGGIALFIIDPQKDFHEGGSLAVPGATADSARIAALLRKHGDIIERVVVTLDTHHAMHIHNGYFWQDSAGNHPEPFTVVSTRDIQAGTWRARQPEMQAWSLKYAKTLEDLGRFSLLIWPGHCILGTTGHAVQDVLMEALTEWAETRARCINWYFKGQNNRTEMYSALKAEVQLDDPAWEVDVTTKLDVELIDALKQHRQVVCCGEAKSHCVNHSVRDLLSGWPADRAEDIIVLEDACSTVTGFEEGAKAFVDDMRAAGVTVTPTDDYVPHARAMHGLVRSNSAITNYFHQDNSAYGSRAGAAGLMDGRPLAATPKGGVALFIIDPQNDFHEGGSLAVAGATADSANIAKLLRAHGEAIERVVVTLDTHHTMHIHNGKFWMGPGGEHPAPFTVIKSEDIAAGKWAARQEEMQEWALEYACRLEKAKRFDLIIWPAHCILGTDGHAVHGPLMEALSEWAVRKSRTIDWRFKGQNNRTEMYSALKAEVELEDDPTTSLDKDLINTLATHDNVVCCGEALSHCVNHSVRDLLSAWPRGRNADIVVLQDAASAVAGCEDQAQTFLSDMRGAGVTVCNTADFKPPPSRQQRGKQVKKICP